MGIGDMVDKAKEALGGEAKIEESIDQAAEAIKEKTPDQADAVVDQAADAAKKVV